MKRNDSFGGVALRDTRSLRATTVRPFGCLIALVALLAGAVPAFAQQNRFSPACGEVQAEAVLCYLKEDGDPKLFKIAQVLASYRAGELSLALIAEVLAGRMTVEQLGDGTAAGLEAVRTSPACDDANDPDERSQKDHDQRIQRCQWRDNRDLPAISESGKEKPGP